jgi:SAM-dependent methyltransferase
MYRGRELETFALAHRWKRYFADLLGPFIEGRVLEVGAGIGSTTRALWSDRVRRWTCLEPDPALARQLVELRLGPGARAPEVVVGTLDQLDTTQRFDTILYVDVLEHIEDDRAETRRAADRLAAGGRLVVLSPAYPFLYSAFDAEIGHHRRYTAESLAAAMPGSLRREALFYADGVGLLLSLANRVLLRQSLPTARQVELWDRVVIPISRLLDPLVGRRFGRSVIGVYSAPRADAIPSTTSRNDGS